MGINLTTLAVFGGAVGVGIGLGLQSIASNFISGLIILLDRSLTIGDFVEMDDGQKGFVREFNMRYAVIETYEGKDILVPNEKFISSSLVNWTHKDPKQRYRVDFSVPYATDIRSMVELVKVAVAEHPQVLSGDDVAFEERPDCEIDSFGDSGVNMFVEDLDIIRERAQIVKDELANALADKMNKNMYILSIVAAVFLPLGFFTGLLGINVGDLPGIDNNAAFLIVCLICLAFAGTVLGIFKYLKWL